MSVRDGFMVAMAAAKDTTTTVESPPLEQPKKADKAGG